MKGNEREGRLVEDFREADFFRLRALQQDLSLQLHPTTYAALQRAIDRLASIPGEREVVDLDAAVSRFLGWKVPKDFMPDGGVSFTPIDYPEHPQMRDQCWPVGTNLLNATQARAMLEHVLGRLPSPRTYVEALAVAGDPEKRAVFTDEQRRNIPTATPETSGCVTGKAHPAPAVAAPAVTEAQYRELLTVEDVALARSEGLRIETQWAGDSWIHDSTKADWPGWAVWLTNYKARAVLP